MSHTCRANTVRQKKELSDPLALNCTERRLLRAVHHLVDLLTEAQPLIEILNSPDTLPYYRLALRYQVDLDKYLALVGGLQAMTSEQAWRAAHADELISPELLQRMEALGVDIAGL